MFIEICLAVLTIALVALVFVLLRISSQAQKSIHLLQTDIQALSKETISCLNALNEFIQDDLHAVSEETRQLIGQLHNLSSDVNNKVHSLNFFFKPLSFLSSKLDGGLYRNNLQNREFDKEAPQNFRSERAIIAGRQGASENENCEEKPRQSKTDSSGCFGIPSGKSVSNCETIPQILKWIASSALLFKTIRELKKNYEKRT